MDNTEPQIRINTAPIDADSSTDVADEKTKKALAEADATCKGIEDRSKFTTAMWDEWIKVAKCLLWVIVVIIAWSSGYLVLTYPETVTPMLVSAIVGGIIGRFFQQ